MTEAGYVVEHTAEGDTLVVTGRWSDATANALGRGLADGLTLNYARGFRESNLEFLKAGWGIRRLRLLDRSVSDLTPIAKLGEALEDLSIQAAPDAQLDIAAHPHLRSLAGEWGLIRHVLSTAGDLETITTWSFDECDLHAFRDMVGLSRLTVKEASRLEALSGVDTLPSLVRLDIVGCPRLTDVSDLSATAATLRRLDLEGGRLLGAIDDLAGLINLHFLGLSECGEIESLRPVARMSLLEKLYAWGSTRVLDNDLSPLLRLPHLNEVRMQDRAAYSPRVREFPPRSHNG
jgi:hypothetical protein